MLKRVTARLSVGNRRLKQKKPKHQPPQANAALKCLAASQTKCRSPTKQKSWQLRETSPTTHKNLSENPKHVPPPSPRQSCSTAAKHKSNPKAMRHVHAGIFPEGEIRPLGIRRAPSANWPAVKALRQSPFVRLRQHR